MKDFHLKKISEAIDKVKDYKDVCEICEISNDQVDRVDDALRYLQEVHDIVFEKDISTQYLSQLSSDVISISGSLELRFRKAEIYKGSILASVFHDNIAIDLEFLQSNLHKAQFNLMFFIQINFFSDNIVAIGANGSGKTLLSNKLKTYINNNGVSVSAFRVLNIPDFSSISSHSKTEVDLKKNQLKDKSNRSGNELTALGQEFSVVLKNLLANNARANNEYRQKAIRKAINKEPLPEPYYTLLDSTLKIWNSLITNATLECVDGMSLVVKKDGQTYRATEMSDGEKVILYLIAQVLQAPNNGFVIVDEPEIYLHKTILTKLWDILENARQDCIFFYLTHDLDFAVTRVGAKKLWVKSFTYPDKWEIETIPDNEIPENLLLELLGSRRNVLFCEGVKGSLDEKIYNILFPAFTIEPVGSCLSVINYTKAFNKMKSMSVKAYGVIDADYHGVERLEKLKTDNVFSLKFAEIENLLLDEDFLNSFSDKFMGGNEEVERIKSRVISELDKNLENQISNYVTSKINYHFNESHVKKGKVLKEVEGNLNNFINAVDAKEWYNKRHEELTEVVKNSDYIKAISLINHKGLKSIVNEELGIKDFLDKAIKFLRMKAENHQFLKRHFPEELVRVS